MVAIVVAKCFLPTRTQQEFAFQSNFITEMKSLHETETESSLNKLCQFLFLQLLFVCPVCHYKMHIFFHFAKTCTECNFVSSFGQCSSDDCLKMVQQIRPPYNCTPGVDNKKQARSSQDSSLKILQRKLSQEPTKVCHCTLSKPHLRYFVRQAHQAQ